MKRDSQIDRNRQFNLSVPGRLCLFGEHSDWAANYGIHRGFCIVIGTDQCLKAVVRPSDHFMVSTELPYSLDPTKEKTKQVTSCPWDADSLLAIAKDEMAFFRYMAGVAYEVLTRFNISNGIEIHITAMDLPLKKGVSSSAAVCTLVARAFNIIYDLRMFPHEIMEIAYHGEKLTGSQCGRMDQACVYGKTPVLLVFDKTKQVQVQPICMRDCIHMFFVDLAGEKNTIQILNDLQKEYFKSMDLQHALGEENERIVRLAYQAMLTGNAERLGALMNEAQRVFDKLIAPYSPIQLKSPLLHEVLKYEGIAEHVYGGKGVGSQGDGTAQFVARSALHRDASMTKIEEAFPQMKCFPLSLFKIS